MVDPATTAPSAPVDATAVDPAHWYKDAIIYQLHVKAFFDRTTTASATSAG